MGSEICRASLSCSLLVLSSHALPSAGRSESTERVWVLHTDDMFGSTAATAFAYAATTISTDLLVALTDDDDDEEEETIHSFATVDIAST